MSGRTKLVCPVMTGEVHQCHVTPALSVREPPVCSRSNGDCASTQPANWSELSHASGADPQLSS